MPRSDSKSVPHSDLESAPRSDSGLAPRSDLAFRTDIQTWHQRLGHLNLSDVRKLLRKGSYSEKETAASTAFDICIKAKAMSRTSHDRLLSAAAGAAVTLAALWLALITAAAATVILRA